MRNVYLDTETTDFIPGQIAELTMIVEDTDEKKIVDRLNYYFTVDEMTEGAEKVHGFSIELLKQLSSGKRFEDHYKEIYNILNGANLVAHNEKFDERFLSSEFWRCGISFRPANRFCTMEAFKDILMIPAKTMRYGKYKNPKLSEVIDYLRISNSKVADFTRELFGETDKQDAYHDSRFDTTAMFVAVQVQRECMHGENAWISRFCY